MFYVPVKLNGAVGGKELNKSSARLTIDGKCLFISHYRNAVLYEITELFCVYIYL